jgi:hypothetical protein
MSENIGSLTDKNDNLITEGDMIIYHDTQWIAMYDKKIGDWIGHPAGSNLATEDIILSEVHNDVELPTS